MRDTKARAAEKHHRAAARKAIVGLKLIARKSVLSCWPGFDQGGGNFDRIVLGAREKFDGTQHRGVEAVSEIGNFRDSNRPSIEIAGAFMQNTLKHEGNSNPARRQRGRDASAGIDR